MGKAARRGCGCLATVMAALIGIPLIFVLISNFGRSKTAQNVQAPPVAQQGAAHSPANEQPALKDDHLSEEPLEAATTADVEQDERDAAEQAEHDATSKLKAAMSLMPVNKKAASERLKEIVEKYPGTEAADDAKELLAGREPKPHVAKAADRSAKRQLQSTHRPTEGTLRAKVLSSKLVDFVSPANGRTMQMVIITLKNTGSKPIRAVDADITSRDSSGKIVTTENGCVFAESDSSPGIAPGHTWTTPKGEGRLLPNLGVGTRAKTVDVKITEVLEHAGMEK